MLALAGVIGARGVPRSAWYGCFSEPPLLSLEQRLAKDDGTLKSGFIGVTVPVCLNCILKCGLSE